MTVCPSSSPRPACPGGEQTVTGVVLAGGQSTRLGQDKTRLRLHGESEPEMLRRTADLLASLVPRVWISCRPGQQRMVDGFACIYDDGDNMGPFGGVLAALRKAQGPVLAVSCDLPFMDRATLAAVLALREKRPQGTLMSTYRQVETGYVEALVAVYEYAALPRFEQASAEGVRQIIRVIPDEFRAAIPYARSEALPFFNVNFPADLDDARRLLAQQGAGGQLENREAS